MKIKEIRAKTLLSHVKQPDTWFGLRYNMNLYRGCQHRCIYCDSRSLCYGIEDFDGEVLVKNNAVERLMDELPRKRVRGTIGTGSMNDPYMPLEKELNLTGRALQVIAQHRFPVHVITKSILVLRDLEILKDISRIYAAVSFTITTADDVLGKMVEPGSPLVSARLSAMRILAENGIYTGVVLMPVLPFIEDNEENIAAIVEKAHEYGASYIIPSFGMSLRDRQRVYYYKRLDELFPGLSAAYRRRFGGSYQCRANDANRLGQVFAEMCIRYGITNRIQPYDPQLSKQLSLFGD
jgi:DNA repair photolyase